MFEKIDNYLVYILFGQWCWYCDWELFDIYYKVIMEVGWLEVGLYEVVL